MACAPGSRAQRGPHDRRPRPRRSCRPLRPRAAPPRSNPGRYRGRFAQRKRGGGGVGSSADWEPVRIRLAYADAWVSCRRHRPTARAAPPRNGHEVPAPFCRRESEAGEGAHVTPLAARPASITWRKTVGRPPMIALGASSAGAPNSGFSWNFRAETRGRLFGVRRTSGSAALCLSSNTFPTFTQHLDPAHGSP